MIELQSAADYITNGFWTDVSRIGTPFQAALPGGPDISVFSLRPATEANNCLDTHGQIVEQFDDPGRFVRAFYLWSFFDQVLHATDADAHSIFESHRYVPKPRGILSGYHCIWDPKYLLYSAAYYPSTSERTVESLLRDECEVALVHFRSIVVELPSPAPPTTPDLWEAVAARMKIECQGEHRTTPRLMIARPLDEAVLREGRRMYRRLRDVMQAALNGTSIAEVRRNGIASPREFD